MTQGIRTSTRALAAVVVNAAFILAGAATAGAQARGADPRWDPWVGCWQYSETSTNAQSTLVCVVPAAGKSAVDIVSIANGKEVQRDRIGATGERQPSTKDGCGGWESAQWSADGRRIYMKSELTCPNALQRTSDGLFAMSAAGEWIAVQAVRAGGGSGMQVVRYRDAGVPAGVPAEIASALSGRAVALSASRLAAGASIGSAEVLDASRQVDAGVVQAWLVERGQRFEIGAKELASLADAGVPGSVTDVMVALAYPKTFAIDPANYDGAMRAPTGTSLNRTKPMYGIFGYPSFGLGYDPYYSRYGYSPYRYSPYGYYSPYGLGYSSYGSGSGWYFNRSPYVIISSRQSAPHGQTIKEGGYTSRGNTTSARTARPRAATGVTGSATRGTSGASRSSGRTAKGRR